MSHEEAIAAKIPIYKNPALSVAKRLNDLLSRMTLEEKAAQMTCVWQKKSETLTNAKGNFDLKKAKAAFKNGHGLGQMARPTDAGKGRDARSMAELTNAIQKFFMENSRLGIPVTFHEECLHGHAGVGSTSFPQPIGLAAAFNPDLAEKLYAMTAGGTAPAVQMNSLMRFSRNSWRPLTLGVTSPFLSM